MDNPGGGRDSNTEHHIITITVEDVNDNSPVFTQSVYRVMVDENAEDFTFTVNATDRDSGQFILYLLSSSLS